MSDNSEKLKKLLDGELGPEALEEDPILAKLAERIYGEEFLENMGLSRGESKRALSETLSDDDGDDLLIEIIPPFESDIEPFEAPTSSPIKSETSETSGMSKSGLVIGLTILVAGLSNLFGLLSFLGNDCTGGGCPTDGHTRINWASIGHLETGWGWSPPVLDGCIGIPDITVLGIGIIALVWTYLKR
jgi:hypothetical protein